MQVIIKMFLFLWCISAYEACGNGRELSLDCLYPETVVSRALRSLRQLLSLAQEEYQNSCPEQVRILWLDAYNAIDKLKMEPMCKDLQEYIATVWFYIDQAHNEFECDDLALAGFVEHMRAVCAERIIANEVKNTKRNQNQYMSTLDQH